MYHEANFDSLHGWNSFVKQTLIDSLLENLVKQHFIGFCDIFLKLDFNWWLCETNFKSFVIRARLC